MTNPFDLSSMRIAISGAGGGIGSATARLVADMGADVMLSDLEAPTPLADQIRSRGRSAAAAGFDVNGAMHSVRRGAWRRLRNIREMSIEMRTIPEKRHRGTL